LNFRVPADTYFCMNDGDTKLSWRSRKLRARVLFPALVLAILTYSFFTWVLWPVKVLGESMLPTYRDGERHFINKLAYISEKPKRGDVVGVRARGYEVYLKRVVGLPGERLTFEGGRIQVNGVPLNERYVVSEIPEDRREPVILAPDHYFVIGDNRETTVLGTVHASTIVGKLAF
jgi:signal peptidase I